MKKHGCMYFSAVLVLGLFMVTANAQATEAEAPMIQLSGLIEVGAVWQDIDYADGEPEQEDVSDLCMTTVALTAEAELNEWVNVEAIFLYEDSTFSDRHDEMSVEVEEAIVTIGNTEEFPLYGATGKMYVPFGALLTHFPDDPLLEAPLTLIYGETLEKAFLVGFKQAGVSVSAYVFNGDMDEEGDDNQIDDYGFDVNYSMDDEAGFDLLVGASYISDIGESDGITELAEAYGIDEYADLIEGFAAYLRVGLAEFFVEAEYMAYLDDIEGDDYPGIAAVMGPGYEAKPSIWNVEVGYNLDWGKNLEIVLKYAGTDEGELGGAPETRYGLCLNQEIFDDVIVSLGYLRDDYDEDEDIYEKDGTIYHRDDRDLVFAQLAIEF